MTSEENAFAVRAWIVDRVTLSIDNDEVAQEQALDYACRSAIQDMGAPGPTLYDYREMHAGRGDWDRRDLADAIGSRISDLIGEWIEPLKEENSFLGAMIEDVLDLTDSRQNRLFGEHYMPDPDDLEIWAREHSDEIDDFERFIGEADDEEDSE